MLAKFFITVCYCASYLRSHSGFSGGDLPAVVGVSAGLLLLTLARVICWLYFLSLLARLFSFALGVLRGGLPAVVEVSAHYTNPAPQNPPARVLTLTTGERNFGPAALIFGNSPPFPWQLHGLFNLRS
jgi:hypothetical protein